MSTPPVCGAQQPSPVPDPFDWSVFAAISTIAALASLTFAVVSFVLALGLTASLTATAGVAGAAAIFALVLYYALKPDGCIRSTPKGEPICLSGIVQDTSDQTSTAVAILAPFAMGPSGTFDVVVKSMYWRYVVAQNTYWVYCNDMGAAMLPCLIKSKTACGAKKGSVVGALVGAVAGVYLGYLAAAALWGAAGCTVTGWFYLLCLLIVLIVAAIVAAVVTYAGATIGGWVGEGIASAGGDPVGDAWKGLGAGAIVTVMGNWVTDPDLGNNELLYTTDINRTGQATTGGPSYTTADADNTPTDDCPINPQPPPK